MVQLIGAALGALAMLVMVVVFTHQTEMTNHERIIFWEALWPGVVALMLLGAVIGMLAL